MATRRRRNPYGSEDEITRAGRRSSEVMQDGEEDMPFVRVTKLAVAWAQSAIRRVYTSVIGPDFTGNPRGLHSFDVQGERLVSPYGAGDVTRVASGDYAIAIGNDNKASGEGSVAVGLMNQASGMYSAALGVGSEASGYYAAALGVAAIAGGSYAVALGFGARAALAGTINLAGAQILRSSQDVTALNWQQLCGAEIVIAGWEIDLLTAVADYYTTFPAGCKFLISECGLIITALDTLVSQPSVRFGADDDDDASLAEFVCTDLDAVGARERFLPANRGVGVTSLSFGVTVAADAAAMKARAYWKGVLVEDES